MTPASGWRTPRWWCRHGRGGGVSRRANSWRPTRLRLRRSRSLPRHCQRRRGRGSCSRKGPKGRAPPTVPRDGRPGPAVWLGLRRNPETGELKTYRANAPVGTSLATLVRLSGMRWPIERCFEAGEQHLGLGDDEVRSWRGWQHHATRVILAHFFLVRLQRQWGGRRPRSRCPKSSCWRRRCSPSGPSTPAGHWKCWPSTTT